MGGAQSVRDDGRNSWPANLLCTEVAFCNYDQRPGSLPCCTGKCGPYTCSRSVKVHQQGATLRWLYDVEDEPLADGATANVYRCQLRQVKTQDAASAQRACKSMQKTSEEERARIMREIEIWSKLLERCNGSEAAIGSVVRLYEVFEEAIFVHLVMELCPGGELYARQAEVGVFNESEAKLLLRQMLVAVAHLHRHGIAHRDLKPENWLLMAKDSLDPLKLADFGSSAEVLRGDDGEPILLRDPVGSPYYVAPEVLGSDGYGLCCDIWSVGVIGYILLSGQPPFDGPDKKAILRSVHESRLGFSAATWASTTAGARGFIASLLTRDASQRPAAEAALSYDWLRA